MTRDLAAKLEHRAGAVTVLVAALLGLSGPGHVEDGRRYLTRFMTHVPSRSPAVHLANGCSIFPPNNVWNAQVRDLPVDVNSDAYVRAIGFALPLHADFSMNYSVGDGNTPMSEVELGGGAAESDPGPYYIPDAAPVEADEDAHVLVVDQNDCRLYELFAARRSGARRWGASSAAIFDLRSNQLRPVGWTSADAAGLPIFPGLVRYDEVKSGAIRHALRFSARLTRREFTWPARHFASRSTDPSLPPLGQRFRLRRGFGISQFAPDAQVIMTALRDYGMLLADNGRSWYLTGAEDSRWSSRLRDDLGHIVGSDFEAVNISSLMINPGSGATRR